ncbi:tRNA nucleotidyltransferase (CCA-adding enzyme) [Aneurinibacillus soli]|uniref:CCA-adding enzyme n=1 Tax=Aneurinibacillus soli TaxID=1500254 RepID=A0A0U5BDR9_9BACL|nr:CCA tRNA nucleotidyltransferase [Aneurinibacillus soli]PYE63081.1 tRNA nucleotidyltransferase (CCA-adding enzyme) [Aneurinibacillus soli]BAU28861.1 CCA-adding enzyme [Aneurinibacillus soli]
MDEQVLTAGKQVLTTLEGAGYTAYFVGGYVRDTILGRTVHDLDVATSAHPEDVIRLFARTVPTGMQHGTVTVLIHGVPIEVTTYRTESSYADHRRPDRVAFVDRIEEDLARRDFTVNAMALGLRGEVIDPFGGQEDLKRGLIRAVGRPQERFAEDALRMLRCIRFASQLRFDIDEQTFNAVRAQADTLGHVAVERISAEWNKALAAPGAVDAVQAVRTTGLFAHMPGVAGLLADQPDEWNLQAITRLSGLAERWAYLFLLGEKTDRVSSVLRALRCEKKLIQACGSTVRIVQALRVRPDTREINRLLVENGLAAVERAAMVQDVLAGQSGTAEALRRRHEQLPVQALTELAVSGADLQQELARRGGPWIRETLMALAEEVNAGQRPNERAVLLIRAKEIADR